MNKVPHNSSRRKRALDPFEQNNPFNGLLWNICVVTQVWIKNDIIKE